MTTATTEPSEVASELTSLDRCDSCGAQAYVRATMPAGGVLLFCAHHAAKHREKLTGLGAQWHDETAKLHASNDRSI
ncbi:MAG: hypothetical protein RLY59_144 [Actinomycetota bacterium]|jgi:hypothetical protein